MQSTLAKQNPLVIYLRMLLYMFVALLLRIAAFAPLGFLFAAPALKWLAVLCPVMVVTIILPLRFSFAEAVVAAKSTHCFSFDRALSLHRYREKLTHSLLHALHVLKWGAPTAVLLCIAYYWYQNVDAATALGAIVSIGQGWTGFWAGLANFFIRLFGSVNTLPSDGGIMEGLGVLLGILGVALAVWLYGAMRNSAARYQWAQAESTQRRLRRETRRLKGNRVRQFWVALINLALWVPFVCVACGAFKGVVSDLSSQMLTVLVSQSSPLLNIADAISPLLTAFLLLYMPLLPVRRWLAATFAVATVNAQQPVEPFSAS